MHRRHPAFALIFGLILPLAPVRAQNPAPPAPPQPAIPQSAIPQSAQQDIDHAHAEAKEARRNEAKIRDQVREQVKEQVNGELQHIREQQKLQIKNGRFIPPNIPQLQIKPPDVSGVPSYSVVPTQPQIQAPDAERDPSDAKPPQFDTRLQNRVQSGLKDQLKNLNIEVDDDDNNPTPPPSYGMDPRQILTVPFGDRINITTPWLFHTGKGDRFKDPDFDDHDWLVLDTTKPLFANMIFDANEIWYRTHIRVAPFSHDLALTVAEFGGSYRVYANGVEIGGRGKMGGRGDYLFARSSTFSIPNSVLEAPELVIVIHAYVGTADRVSLTLRDGISPGSSVFLGPSSILRRDEKFYFATGLTESTGVLTLWVVLLVLAIALSFLIPGVPAYPLLSIFAAGHLVSLLFIDFAEFHYLPYTHWLSWPIRIAGIASDLAALEFCRIIAGLKRRVWFIAFEIFYVLAIASILPAALGMISYIVHAALLKLSFYILIAVIVVLIALGIRRRKQDAYVLAATGGVYLFYLAVWKLLQYLTFNWQILNSISDYFVDRVRPGPTGDLAIVVGFLALTIVRTLRIVRERASIASEIQAARTMQQLLLGQTVQPTPGFTIETVYHPAGEVGGDFFLVSPTPDGSVTLIVGDVSGKGLLAAMRVSMILGILRREPSRNPADMLYGLNEALVSQGQEGVQMGFTTAICVRIEPSGRYTVANAGHISPYIVGVETTTPPALPLGLAAGQVYETVSGTLQPGERLVLLSDGIPEARTARGELYGFERLAALTLQPASHIAAVAQSFGQDDDITVVTIARLPVAPGSSPAPPPPPPLVVAAPPPPMVSSAA